ncbi:MAG: hypothetical protein ACOYOK_08200 [Pseudobdellovibrionaceae bacterium]
MKPTLNTLMQSKYFHPAFNSAIYDGPVRIYFAQFHESLALKIYFLIQQKLITHLAKARDISRKHGAHIFIMIYPTVDSFLLSFEDEGDSLQVLKIENWHNDIVIGLRGPVDDEQLETLMSNLEFAIDHWRPKENILSMQPADINL